MGDALRVGLGVKTPLTLATPTETALGGSTQAGSTRGAPAADPTKVGPDAPRTGPAVTPETQAGARSRVIAGERSVQQQLLQRLEQPKPYATTPESYEADANVMVGKMHESVAGMVARGERVAGSDVASRLANNSVAFWGEAITGKEGLKRCYPQVEQLRVDLGPTGIFGKVDELGFQQRQVYDRAKRALVDAPTKWLMETKEVDSFGGLAKGGHWVLEARPADPKNTDITSIILDPWRDEATINRRK